MDNAARETAGACDGEGGRRPPAPTHTGGCPEETPNGELRRLRHLERLAAVGMFAAGVAHDLGGALTAIAGHADLAARRLEDLPGGPERIGKSIREILRGCGNANYLVRNLLEFARPEAAEFAPWDIGALVTDALALAQALLRRDGILVTLDVADGELLASCAPQEITEVVIDLVTNARDALNRRYPEEHADKLMAVTVRRIELNRESWIRTTVVDHGGGIPEGLQSRVCDPFFTTKSETGGTGLGLYISREIAEKHGGRLLIESESGRSATFHLDLPAAEP